MTEMWMPGLSLPRSTGGGEEALGCDSSVLLQWPASGGVNPTLQSQCPSANMNPTSTDRVFSILSLLTLLANAAVVSGCASLKMKQISPLCFIFCSSWCLLSLLQSWRAGGSPAQSEVTAW